MINCLEPNIIINKSRHVNKVYRCINDWEIIIRDQIFLFVPSPKKAKIKVEELDSCYYLNKHTGEMVPIYLEVPCNKCIICKDKKALDWATRITCESNYHVNCPWWITLTYNDLNLPKDGLNKRHLQNFFKRLRERISRQVGEDIRIRFVAVGEYGSNYKRPHYHAQIFGMPSISPKDMLTILENSWSKRVSYKRFREIFDKLGDKAKDFTFIRENIHGKPMYYERIGFAYVKPAHDNTPLYLAKYMFKPEINTPEGANPNFTLSSRKNGIGYEYVMEYMDYHRCNPELTQIEFLNKHTMKLCQFGIPQYYKDYWFPTISKIVPNEIRKSYNEFQRLYNRIISLESQLLKDVENIYSDVDELVDNINNNYEFYIPITKGVDDLDDLRLQDEFFSNAQWQQLFREEYVYTYQLLYKEYNYLMQLEFDHEQLEYLFSLRDRYKGACHQYYINQPYVSPQDEAYRLSKEYQKRKSKDRY